MGSSLTFTMRQAAKRMWYFGRRFSCPVCGAHTRLRHTYSFDFDVLKKLDVVGGEYVEADDCPICFANQRIRLIYAALTRSGRPQFGDSVLHIAPERALYEHLFAKTSINYVPADLIPERYPYIPGVRKADITDLTFEDATFDLILCNHVLEHVPDDRKAMSELRRVLKPMGVALLQVPIANKLEQTDEDPTLEDPAAREARFGQFDHVRIYSEPDYIERLRSSGFAVTGAPVSAILSRTDMARYHVNPREKLMVCGSERAVATFVEGLKALAAAA